MTRIPENIPIRAHCLAILVAFSPTSYAEAAPPAHADAGSVNLAMASGKKPARGRISEKEISMSKDAFGLSDAEYFFSPLKSFSTTAERLEDEGFDGLIIGGPGYVPLGNTDRFPITALRVTESLESSRHLFREYALITAVDLQSGELHASPFMERSAAKVTRNLQNNPPPPGRVSDGGATNLFTALHLPNRTGEYLVTALVLGMVSNRLHIKVGLPEFKGDSLGFREALRKNPPGFRRQGKVLSATDITSRMKVEESPALPEKPGIGLSALSLEKGPSGSSRVRIFCSYHLLPSSTPKPEESPARPTRDFHPITLLATGTRVSAPHVWALDIEPPDRPPADRLKPITGYFTLLLDSSKGIEGNQSYFFFAFSGSLLAGPVKVDLGQE